MSDLMSSIRALEASASKVLGCKIEMMIARCPAWGSDDCCVIVKGERHAAAAASMVLVAGPGAKVELVEQCGFRGAPDYTYSVVTFPAKPEAAS